MFLASALTCAGAPFPSIQAPTGPAGRNPGGNPSTESFLTVERGEGFEPLRVPRGERLDFVVVIDTFLGDIEVGTVSLTSGTEPYNAGLPGGPGLPVGAGGSKSQDAAAPKDAPRLVGTIQSVAHGSYLGYTLHHELDVRHLPQQWPSSIYRDRQSGSENRQRELKLGVLDGKPT